MQNEFFQIQNDILNNERGLSDRNEGPVVAQAQFLYAPPDVRRGEDEERTAISGLDRGERKKKSGKTVWFATKYLSALYWMGSNFLLSIFSSPRSAWASCNSQLPRSFLGSSSAEPLIFTSARSQNPSLYLTDTYATRE